jgi:hypothetical protein
MGENVDIETNVPFEVAGVNDPGDSNVAVVVTFYKRKDAPDVRFGLTPHSATHLVKYIRETLAEEEVLGPGAEPILPRHPARGDLGRQLRAVEEWDADENAMKDQLDGQSRDLILRIFDRLTGPEQTRLLQEMTERMP